MYAYAYWSDYSGKSSISVESLLAQQKVDLLSQAQKIGRNYQAKNKEEIEQALNFFLPNGNSSSILTTELGFNAGEIKQIEDAIKAKINAAISKYSIGGIGWNDLTASAKGSGKGVAAGGSIEKGNLRWELGNADDWNRFESIQQRLQILTKGIKDLPIGDIRGNLMDKLVSLKQQWIELKKETNISEKNYFGKMEEVVFTGKNSNFITDLNNLMGEFKQKAASYVTGQIGEMWAAASANLYKQITEQAFADVESVLKFIGNDNFMSGLVGTDRESHFIDNKNLSSLSYGINADGKTVTFSGIQGGSAKQGKVDFQLQLPDAQKISYDLSIKNYSNKAEHLTIHSGSSIVFLLQQYGDLLDYFINVAPREGMPEAVDENGNKKIIQTDETLANFNEVEKLMKISLIAQGLMGAYTTGTNRITDKTADTLVLFRNGKYHVYFMSDIINNLINNINNLNNLGIINNTKSNSSLDFSNLKNVWIGPEDERSRDYGLQRTAALLVKLHEIKMEISITMDALV